MGRGGMPMDRCIGVIGGDRRQAELARLLAAEGHRVFTYGLDRWGADSAVDLAEAAAAEVVVLPLPLCSGEGVLNLEGGIVATDELFRLLRPEQRILAGLVKPQQYREAEAHGVKLEDYFLREEVTVANAALTAEAAVQVAMDQLECSMLGLECLVLGFGRIGKLLCHRLQGMGARVSASARTAGDLAWIRVYGWNDLETQYLDGKLSDFGVVFNTIPALVLEESLLRQLPGYCLCIELASTPGIDPAAAEKLGIPYLWARSLPGRVKPRAAAKILRDSIDYILMEG